MAITKRRLNAAVLVVLAAAMSAAQAALPQTARKEERKTELNRETPVFLSLANEGDPSGGTPVLWHDPGAIESLNLFYGPGGQSGAPDPAGRLTYIRDQLSGTQKKIIVKDEQGRTWTVKFGPEARPETAASRIVWAVGYHTHQDYFVKEAHLEGYSTSVIHNVRFQRRDDGYKTIANWDWKSNPFTGKCEFDGLKTLMALLDNWDLKALNNKIERPANKADEGKLIYFVSDLGATFGRTKSGYRPLPFTADLPADRGPGKQKAKGDPAAYTIEKFITEKKNGQIKFYLGRTRGRQMLKNVSVEDACWLGQLLARLSVEQLSDAFRAGGYDENEVRSFVDTMRKRIQMLSELK